MENRLSTQFDYVETYGKHALGNRFEQWLSESFAQEELEETSERIDQWIQTDDFLYPLTVVPDLVWQVYLTVLPYQGSYGLITAMLPQLLGRMPELFKETGDNYEQCFALLLELVLAIAAYSDVYECEITATGTMVRIYRNDDLNTPELMEMLDDGRLYNLPSLTPPKLMKSNRGSQVWGREESIILNNSLRNHDYPLNLIALKAAGAVGLKVNKKFMGLGREHVLELDESELSKFQLANARKNHRQFLADREFVMELVNDEFFLPHKFDARGRMYQQGHHLKYGDDYSKAMIQFSETETIEIEEL